jgi:hypothetical protein
MLPEAGQTWFEFALRGRYDASDPFLRFIGVWIAFNALYEARFPGKREWKQIVAISADDCFRRCHTQLLKQPSYAEAVSALSTGGVSDTRTGLRREITAHTDLAAVLSCVYQVRCNLFHGGKDRSNERDRLLAAAGFVVVGNLVEYQMTGSLLRESVADLVG